MGKIAAIRALPHAAPLSVGRSRERHNDPTKFTAKRSAMSPAGRTLRLRRREINAAIRDKRV
ncbi:MAG: hypothetical protein WBZ39_01400 [Methylovirgula sp.]